MAKLTYLELCTLFFLTISQYSLVCVQGGDIIPERICGTLYSEPNFQGHSFTLNDFDFSADTSKDYRSSLSGWQNTSSVRMEKECSMYFCSNKNFQGTCNRLNQNISQPTSLISEIQSANCTCVRDCNCEDVIVPRHQYGRRYFKGGCQLCDTEYLNLMYFDSYFLSQRIQTYKMRKGCNLTLYSDTRGKKISKQYHTEIIENNFNIYASYRVSCNTSAYRSPTPKRNSLSDPKMISLPETSQDLLQLANEMITTNGSLAKHPGILAALKSWQNERSWKNAYILLIGTSRVDDTLDTRGCGYSNNGKIRECRISQPLDNLGTLNSEIRIIYYDLEIGISSNVEDDYVLMASLEDYLSNHEELKQAVPNAVVLYHDISSIHQGYEEYSLLERKLRIINALRARILDEEHSNIIFYLNAGKNPDISNLDEKITNFEKDISRKWTFPKPTLVVARASYYYFGFYLTHVNGYQKQKNGEYFPLNLLQRLRVICRGSGDPLGEAIFNKMFVESGIPWKINLTSSPLLPENHTLVQYYRFCSIDLSAPNCSNGTQKVQFQTQLKNLERTINSTNLNATYDICYCTAVRNRIDDHDKVLLLTQERLNRSEERNADLELKLAEQTLVSENLTSQIQGLVEQLAEVKKSQVQENVDTINSFKKSSEEVQALQDLLNVSEEKHNRSTDRYTVSESRIQQLEIQLANRTLISEKLNTRIEQLEAELLTQKNSRDDDIERVKGEILDDIKHQLNILYGNV